MYRINTFSKGMTDFYIFKKIFKAPVIFRLTHEKKLSFFLLFSEYSDFLPYLTRLLFIILFYVKV